MIWESSLNYVCMFVNNKNMVKGVLENYAMKSNKKVFINKNDKRRVGSKFYMRVVKWLETNIGTL